MLQGSCHSRVWWLTLIGGLAGCGNATDVDPRAGADSSTSVAPSGQTSSTAHPPVTSGPPAVTPTPPPSAVSPSTSTAPGPSGAPESSLSSSPGSVPPSSIGTETSEGTSEPGPSGGLQPVNSDPSPTSQPGSDATGTEVVEQPTPEEPMLPQLQPAAEAITFGTQLEAAMVMATSRALAQQSSDPTSPEWQSTGDQRRTYHFDETNTNEPYRLYVPTTWDKQAQLPLVMFLHGAGSNENTYVDQNDKLMVRLAEEHGFVLVSPLGVSGAYGNFLRLSAPFGNPQGAAELMAQVTPESLRTNELSEKDVINVLERVLAEYPIDHSAMYLTGHSMGSGGTWYIGGKYSTYWRAIAPMSGPFVQETGYPWVNLEGVGIFVTEGIQTPSLDASRLLAGWLTANGFDSVYEEVDADHGGMVPLVLPSVFTFFDAARR